MECTYGFALRWEGANIMYIVIFEGIVIVNLFRIINFGSWLECASDKPTRVYEKYE